ncbi:immunoglobulin superfamily member 1-like [Heteronotia binoei]|uniref:immunoglobulin superfamily member 1-like n=1 Tax=Heteronotia binoei TaxID=13085 RepID=UPI0029308A32|nr:immunoglobulin superfamily member 1-like [Heteronotia binoei]
MIPALFIFFFCMLSILSGKDVQRKNHQAPKISIKPHWAVSLGDNVTIICEGLLFSLQYFYLEKDGQEISSKNGIGNTDFPIANANREHGGNYTCSYKDLKSQSKSQPSEPVELLIRDPVLPRPSIYLSPSRVVALGSIITILCMVQGPSKRFYLHTGEDEKTMEPYKDFAFLYVYNINWDDGKSYQCSYSAPSGFFISEPSNPMELLIVDPKLPRPSISLSPMDGVTVGRNVTIDCLSQDTAKNFYLQKLSDPLTDEPMQTEGRIGKLLLNNASVDHHGNYSCSYQPKSEPFRVSELSDPVELLITDPDLPRPMIFMSPTGATRLRSNITIYCSINDSFVMFHLYKAGDPMTSQPMEADEDMAMFSINNVSVNDSGVYHCCYRPPLKSFFISKPSNQVELLVLDPGEALLQMELPVVWYIPLTVSFFAQIPAYLGLKSLSTPVAWLSLEDKLKSSPSVLLVSTLAETRSAAAILWLLVLT